MLVRAVERWNQPVEISSGLMLVVAIIGAAANTAGLLILRGGKDESLNLRAGRPLKHQLPIMFSKESAYGTPHRP